MIKQKIHKWCQKMWDERKLSAEFTPEDEATLVSLVVSLIPISKPKRMTDKERILMTILRSMDFTQKLCLNGVHEQQFVERDGGYVHFGGYDDRHIQIGDLVMGATSHYSHEFMFGWVHKIINEHEIIMREIGSERLCHYGNEKFVRIVGVDPSLLLEGDKYEFDQKVQRAFAKGDHYVYRYGGVTFHDDQEAEIFIREVFGGLKNPSKPFFFKMKWNKRTSVSKILKTMIENGYGTRKFELIEQEPK